MQVNSQWQFFPKIKAQTGSTTDFWIRTNNFVLHVNFEAELEESEENG